MSSNLDRIRDDLKRLIDFGNMLDVALKLNHHPKEVRKQIDDALREGSQQYIAELPDFMGEYETWYSEALAVVKQLVPDRLPDFRALYEKPKARKDITYENYVISDALVGLRVGQFQETVVDSSAEIAKFSQQLAILKSARQRLKSSLFEIQQLVQADLFDSEIDVARELLKKKFVRAAGAIGGVVLEKHLAQVCRNHNVTVIKKNPSIADFNEALKKADVIEVRDWRYIQHLGDIRNLCDHNKNQEPTVDDVSQFIDGVAKIMKTLH